MSANFQSKGVLIEGGVHVGQFSIERSAYRRGYSCRPILNKKRVLIDGGYACRQLSNRKGC